MSILQPGRSVGIAFPLVVVAALAACAAPRRATKSFAMTAYDGAVAPAVPGYGFTLRWVFDEPWAVPPAPYYLLTDAQMTDFQAEIGSEIEDRFGGAFPSAYTGTPTGGLGETEAFDALWDLLVDAFGSSKLAPDDLYDKTYIDLDGDRYCENYFFIRDLNTGDYWKLAYGGDPAVVAHLRIGVFKTAP